MTRIAGYRTLNAHDDASECALSDWHCNGALLAHTPAHCGGGDYSDQMYFACTYHAREHARDYHHLAETMDGFVTQRYQRDIRRIDCLRCGMRNVVEGTIASDADWNAARDMLDIHNATHHA